MVKCIQLTMGVLFVCMLVTGQAYAVNMSRIGIHGAYSLGGGC